MPKITITIIIVLLIAAFFYMGGPDTITGMITAKPLLQYGDFDITVSWDSEVSDQLYYGSDGLLHGWFSVRIDSNRDDLFYRVYEENTELTVSERGGARTVALGGFDAEAELQNLQESKNIEVCVSLDEVFMKYSEGVVCKTARLNPPRIDVALNPDPVVFEISNISKPYYSDISITNTGEKSITFEIFLPNHLNSNYSELNPQYTTEYGFGHNATKLRYILNPGDTIGYEIMSYIYSTKANFTEHEAIGYVWAFSDSLDTALFKKSFKLRTTMVR